MAVGILIWFYGPFLKIDITMKFSILLWLFTASMLLAATDYSGEFARANFESALRVSPKDTLVLLNLGDVCVKLKDIKKARDYYEQVIQIDPKSEDAASAKQALQQPALK